MKTVSKINPEQEYEKAKELIEVASRQALNSNQFSSLDSSVNNLITATRILIEREERRRGKPSPPPVTTGKGRKSGQERADVKKTSDG